MNNQNHFQGNRQKLMAKGRRPAILLLWVLLLLSGVARLSAIGPADDRQLSASGSGAVSCGHPMAAAAALHILKNGGNAVDAAVAAGFMLGVVDFSNSGIGGDGFALVCSKGGSITAFDGSTRRPSLAVAQAGKSYIGLPTVPELLLKLHRLYGKTQRAKVMLPAVNACFNGFRLTSYLEKVVEKKLLSVSESKTSKFLAPDGYPLRAGQFFKQPRLGMTLLRLAADGGQSFYRGDDAKQMLADMQVRGSLYQAKDLAGYRSRPVRPLRYDYHGFSIYGTPPPSCAIATIKLAIDLLESGIELFPSTPEQLIKIARAGQRVISSKYSGLAACLADPEKFFAMVDKAVPGNGGSTVTDTNTTHLCVWDKDGMIVSLTLTLGNHFGTGELAPGGFFYNNGLRNYSDQVAGYPADYPADAGPVSAKSPLIVMKGGRPWLAIGGAGADRIIFNTALVLARVVSGHDLHRSIAAPRFYLDYRNRLSLEWHPDMDLLKKSEKLVADAEVKTGCDDFFGLVSAIQRKENGSLLTAADQRRDGSCRAGD